MTLRLRPTLHEVPVYVPGRSAADVAAAYGLDRVVKLASNESAHGPLPGVLDRALAVAGDTHRYPDADARALRSALADAHDLDADRIVGGCGSVALCQQLVLATAGPGDEVLFGWRSFEAYPVFAAVTGATGVRVPLREEALDLDAMAAALSPATRLVLICTPNNPTGTAVGGRELARFCDAVPPDVCVVIDEAYREYAVGDDVADGVALARERPNVAVLRTFSKAYGLASLRVGWCYGPAELADALRRTAIPFALSALAQAAAIESLREPGQVRSRAAEVVAERDRVSAALHELGVAVPVSAGNFVWLPLRERSVSVAEALLTRGVIVRAFAGDGVRVTIGLPQENDLFLTALGEVLRR